MCTGLVLGQKAVVPVSGGLAWERAGQSVHTREADFAGKANCSEPNTTGAQRKARQEPKAVDRLAVALAGPTAAVYFGAQGLVKTCLVPKIN